MISIASIDVWFELTISLYLMINFTLKLTLIRPCLAVSIESFNMYYVVFGGTIFFKWWLCELTHSSIV